MSVFEAPAIRRRATAALRTPPMVSGGLPGVGHALEFNRDREHLARRGFEEHGQVFGVRLGPKNLAMVIGPENQRTFFMETGHKLDMHAIYGYLRAIFGEVLFLAPQEEYLRQRPLVKELFGREQMVRHITRMEEVVGDWLDELGGSGDLELTEAMTLVVQQVAGMCFLGPDVVRRIGSEFWASYQALSDAMDPLLPPGLPHPKFIRRDRAKARLIELIRPIVDERLAEPEAYDDFLQQLIVAATSERGLIDEEQLRNLLVGLVFASHETTIGQAAWTIILLLQNPWYLQLVLDELDREAPGDTPMDHTALARLQHLWWAVREVERMRPSIPLMMRLAVEDISFGDHVVPAGWLVQVVPGLGHNLPSMFDRPGTFDPLRFAPGREEDKQDRFALIGFGGGTHRCSGISFANSEMVLIAAMLLRRFDLELRTTDTQVVRTLGANKASPTMLRYRRRDRNG